MTARSVLVWLLPLAAFWPIWRWYAARITDSPEDSCGLLALSTAVLLIIRGRKSSNSAARQRPQPKMRMKCNSPSLNKGLQANITEHTSQAAEPDRNPNRISLIMVLLLYAATYPFFPPLMRAFLGVAGVCLTVTAISPGRRVPAAVWGLFFLSLPVIPTLQFYLGYPLRRIATFLAVPFLHLAGYSVEVQGTTLCWMGESVLVDAPCSGVKMMWTGSYVLLTACALSMMTFPRTVLAGLLALGFVLVGNALRVALLFFIETHRFSAWLHQGTGILVFVLTALMIIWSLRWIAKQKSLWQSMSSHAWLRPWFPSQAQHGNR